MTRKAATYFLVVVIFVAGVASGVAIDAMWLRPTPGLDERLPRAHGKLAMVAEELSLTEEQVEGIEEILASSQSEHQKIIRKACPDVDSIRDDLEPLRNEMSNRIRELLTIEQRELYDQLRERRKRGRAGRPAPLGRLLGPAPLEEEAGKPGESGRE